MRAAEWGFAIGSIVWLSGGVDLVLYPRGDTDVPVFAARLLPYALMFIVPPLALATRRRLAVSLVIDGWPFLLPVLVAAASALWSVAPLLTLGRSAVFAATTTFGIFLAARFDTRDQLRIVAVALGITALASVIAVALFPEVGISAGHGGAWAGVFRQKNVLGRWMALAALSCAFLLSARGPERVAVGISLVLSLVLVAASRSVSSIATAAACLGAATGFLFLLRARPGAGRAVAIAGVGTLVAASLWALTPGDGTLALVGRDPTLNQRTRIWTASLEVLQQRPWLGYGYGAFWRGPETEPSAQVYRALQEWYPWTAHNGFLDLGLELGAFGLAAFLLPLAALAVAALRLALVGSEPLSGWPLALILFFLLSNVTESALLWPKSLSWALYVTVALGTVRGAGRRDQSRSVRTHSLWRRRRKAT